MNALDHQTVAQCAQLVDFDQVERAGMSLRLDRFNFSGAIAGAQSSGAALRRPHIFCASCSSCARRSQRLRSLAEVWQCHLGRDEGPGRAVNRRNEINLGDDQPRRFGRLIR